MKLLENKTNSLTTETCAAAVMDTVPLIMRIIRSEMRSHRASDLSVPQFRALVYIRRCAGASLSDVAEHVGLALPSVSKLIDKLVARGLIVRQDAPSDRRRVTLMLTPNGEAVLQAASQATQQRLIKILNTLSPDELISVIETMNILYQIFALDPASNSQKGAA